MTLPEGWKQGQLGELCAIEIGGTPSRGVAAYWDPAHDTSNVWVSIRDMRQHLITGSAEQISDLGVKKSNVKLQQPGTVLLSFKLSIGRVAIAGVPLFTNEAIAGLSPTGLTREFLFQGLQGWDLLQGVDQAIKGATLNKQKLKKILFEYPDSEREQAKIAEVLSAVDRAIEQTEALIAKQQRIKTGLIQDLLTRGIDEHGKLRSEHTHKFKDSPLGRIPVEWDVTKIGDQFVERKERGRAGLPVMSIVMNAGLVKRSSVDRRVETALSPEQHALVCESDIAYNMMRMWQGVLGRASSDCLVSPAYVVLRALESIDSRFAQWLFTDRRTIHAFRQASKGVVDDRLRLYPKDLFPIPMAMPKGIDEQSFIADRLDAQLAAIESAVRGLEKLHLLKRGLMHDLLTGNRRVTRLLASPKQVVGA